ncbi:hypothetical protein [Paenibacillus sp. sgz500958]|uniref:hypothetical protein n=1 Tax=Paenibacillus sp. sgz500958 TaxID=3242475 RepID=UPI0036D43E7E
MKENGQYLNNKDVYKAYLSGKGSEIERNDLEHTLLEDEEALALYMEALDELEDELPALGDTVSFATGVMDRLQQDRTPTQVATEGKSGLEQPRRSRWYDKPIVHYVVAASLTLLFLSSGVFDKLLSGNMDVVVQQSIHAPSYSEKAMQTASGWLDQLMNDGDK